MKNNKVKAIVLGVVIVALVAIIAFIIINAIQMKNKNLPKPVATIEIEEYGTIKAELYPEFAPNTVKNFIALANNGFYDGLVFHRTIPGFMIQGGDPLGEIKEKAGSGSASTDYLTNKKDINNYDTNEKIEEEYNKRKNNEYHIKGEFLINDFKQNTLSHEEGVLSMARSDYSQVDRTVAKKGYDSASSQFFIVSSTDARNSKALDGSYAAFGKVTEGLDIVKKIAETEVETREQNSEDQTKVADRPVKLPKIKSIRVETFGAKYDLPQTLTPFDINAYMQKKYSQIQGFSGQ